MNKQVLSIIITLFFIIPILFFLEKSLINKKTSFYKIEGVVSKIKLVKKNKKLKGQVYIYYNDNKDYIKFEDDLLIGNTLDTRWKELSESIKKYVKFKAIKIDTFDTLLYLKVNTLEILTFNNEVEKFNNQNYLFTYIIFFIGFIVIIGNIFIAYYKLNSNKWIEHSFFQKILYLVAIMGIIRFFFDS